MITVSILKRNKAVRIIVVCLVATMVAWILTEVVWGGAAGFFGGLHVVHNKEYQQKIISFLKEHGINPEDSRREAKSKYKSLPEKDRKALLRLGKEALADFNWFYFTLSVSVVVFAIVGFLSGLWAKSWLFSGIIPILTFFTNNPVIRFHWARGLPSAQKVVIVLLQFVSCYLLAYYGAKVGIKKQQRKERSIKQVRV